MAGAPTTRLHVSGHRFLLRRLECALVGRDIRTVNEPLRGHAFSLLTGSLLAAVAVAGCAIVGLFRPQTALGDAPIVMGRDSGALYVRVGEVWHPVLNLASARLIAAANVKPELVRDSELGHIKRGPLLGIPGAPQYLGEPLPPDEAIWTVCDSAGRAPLTTTAIVGRTDGPAARRLAVEQAVLVTTDANAAVYLLYNGRRAVVNLADPVVARALRLEDQVPRRVSRILLNAVPEAPPITVPQILGSGDRRMGAVPGFPVGSVLRVTHTGGDEYYVVFAQGVQRVGQVAADMLRLSDSQGNRSIVAVAPDVIRTSPTVNALPVSTFPDRASAPLDLGNTTLCVSWTPHQDVAEVSFLAGHGLPLPADQTPVTLAQADIDGPALDAVYIPPGRTAYVRATGLTGDKTRAGTRYLVTDAGVRFGIYDDAAARDLGLPAATVSAPWPVLAALPQGPELSRQNASVARDTVAVRSRMAGQPAEPGGR